MKTNAFTVATPFDQRERRLRIVSQRPSILRAALNGAPTKHPAIQVGASLSPFILATK